MTSNKILKAVSSTVLASTALIASSVSAENWSSTEVQLQLGGDLEIVGANDTSTANIITFQHAGGWDYGDNFFFVDHTRWSDGPAKDTSEFYGEWYSNFSLGAITGNEIKFGPVKDIGIVAGFNFAPEVDSNWVLPGVRFALDLPGFAFAQIDVTAYIHQGGGSGGFDDPFTVIDEDTSFMIDFAWAYPFKMGNTNWSIEGHLEYIDGRTQTHNFGTSELESWILFQPQIRLDAGELIGMGASKMFVGIEYQYWKNKLGEKGTDDNAVQLLAVWRF